MTAILERFSRFLERAERSPRTIRNYRGDLEGLAAWLTARTAELFSPSRLTPADLRAYKRWLIAQDLKASTIHRKLATLKSFLHGVVEARLLRGGHGLRVPTPPRKSVVAPAGWTTVSSIDCSEASRGAARRGIRPPQRCCTLGCGCLNSARSPGRMCTSVSAGGCSPSAVARGVSNARFR
jgi:Phage integrase, N-terminal SAM-like domain